jgi:predicted RND superfamily exporter protein
LLPAVLAVLPLPRRAADRVHHAIDDGRSVVSRFLDRLAPLVTRRPLVTVAVGLAVVALGAAGFPRVIVDGSLVQNFPLDNPVKLADDALIAHFGGSQPVEIVVEAASVDAWKQPELLRAVGRRQERLEASGMVSETRSIVDYIKRMNAVMNPQDAAAYRVPDDPALIAQYLLLYSISGDPDDFDDVVDYDYRLANVRAQAASDHSPTLARTFRSIDTLGDELLAPLGLSLHGSGAAKTSYTFMDLLLGGQIRSLALALPLVVVATGIMLGSIAGGLLAALPVFIATVLNIGMLGWLGVPLGVTTALMSSLGIGIGIDYAIHFIVRYRTACRGGAAPEAAMHLALGTSGVAILYNAAVVVAGFLVLATSQFYPNRSLGYLVSFNMLVCFAGTITLLAALLYRLQPAFVEPTATAPPGESASSSIERTGR